MEHKNKFVKSLCIAAFLSILCLPQINSKAMAQAPVPTLDRLNQEGATIPDTDPPQVYPESVYTLTEIENADPENLPQNAITLYDKTEVIKYYDPQTGQEVAADDRLPDIQYKEVTTIETTPKYYLVNLKDSVTNIGEGDTTKYFEWSQNADGRLELKEVSAPTEGKNTITVKYDTSSLLQRIPNDADKSSTNISGTFVNQTTGSTSGDQYGGAIYNNGSDAKLGDINADFIGNYASSNSDAAGGAIYNKNGTIGDITGDFIGNYASGRYSASGGAIYNRYGTIGDITGDFIGNYASSTNYYARGGAIYNNSGTIGDIKGDFIGNYTVSTNGSAQGGAIYNEKGTIGNITSNFICNYVSSINDTASGGAILHYDGTIKNITGDFIGNYAFSIGNSAFGGAISNNGGTIIKNITGDFIGNSALGSSSAKGGAIYNWGTIRERTGDFIGNYALSTNDSASGGAVYNNRGTIGNITGDFIGNYASGNSTANGGAIYNIYGDIGAITGDFIGNYTFSTDSSAYGGAIYNYSGAKIGNITGDFIGNYAKTESDSQLALGGAVYTGDDMNFIADNQTNYFSGNYTEDYRGKINNAIFVQTSSSSSPTIKLQAQNNGVIIFDDQIDGGVSKKNSQTGKYEIDRTNAYNLSLTGDETGTIYLNNSVINAKVTSDKINLNLGKCKHKR